MKIILSVQYNFVYSVGRGKKGKALQELRMLSSVTLKCQFIEIVMNSGYQLSEQHRAKTDLTKTV